MKKKILMLMLAAMSTGAMAEWVFVGDWEQYRFYVDPTTIRKNGNIVKMWTMTDSRIPSVTNSKAYMSTKALEEYDCANETLRTLSLVDYEKSMGTGNVVYSTSYPSPSEPVVPGTVGERRWEIGCGKIKLK